MFLNEALHTEADYLGWQNGLTSLSSLKTLSIPLMLQNIQRELS